LIPGAPSNTRDAELKLAGARAAYEQAKAHRTALEGEIEKVEGRLLFSEASLKDAVAAAVRSDPAVCTLLSEFADVHRRYVDLRRALEFLDGKSMLPANAKHWFAEPEWLGLPILTHWRSATDALMENPDAPLSINEFSA
jgi:hypothetical protein